MDLSLLEAELRGAVGISELTQALWLINENLARLEKAIDRQEILIRQIAMGMGIRP